MATKAKVFGKFIHIMEENKFKRSQELQASRMARRIFFRQQSLAFHQWLEHATKQRRAKAFIRRRLLALKNIWYLIWKEKWLIGHRAREREAKARAFIKRYQLRSCVKCLYCLREHASLQIRYGLLLINGNYNQQNASTHGVILSIRIRVRALINQLGKIEAYCFEL